VSPEYDLSDPDAVAFCPSCGSGYTARVARCQPCDVALVSRAEVERGAAEPAPDEDEAEAEWAPEGVAGEAESTELLCRMEDPVKWEQLADDLHEAGVPYWPRSSRWQSLGGAPPFVEFRVPARYLDAARRVLARLEG
jgi:hypothetical protein